MGRSRPKTGAANKKPRFDSLREEDRETLINFLGLDPSVNPNEQEKATQAMIRVEQILRLYWRNLESFESLPGTKPKGRPKQEVFQKAIGELRRTFRQYSDQIDNKRKITGAISKLSPAENDEKEFVHLALEKAGTHPPDLKKIRRSYHKQGTPLADRNKVIKNIEEEAERRAKKSTAKEDKTKK